MKRFSLILSAVAAVLAASSCISNAPKAENGETSANDTLSGAIVYFNMDRIGSEYDMANDLRSDVERTVAGINEDVNRRGSKLERDIKAFQDKINKGTITQTTAQAQSQKLAEQQQEFEQYAGQKQQEILEEQQVMTNQIADAISTFVKEYQAEKGYAMIIATQGDLLSLPIVAADSSLDITDALLEGLNAAYVKTKSSK